MPRRPRSAPSVKCRCLPAAMPQRATLGEWFSEGHLLLLSVLSMPTQSSGPTLCVDVPAPVRWRNASDPRFYSRDRKGEGGSRLRGFNVEAGRFNKCLPADIVVSS